MLGEDCGEEGDDRDEIQPGRHHDGRGQFEEFETVMCRGRPRLMGSWEEESDMTEFTELNCVKEQQQTEEPLFTHGVASQLFLLKQCSHAASTIFSPVFSPRLSCDFLRQKTNAGAWLQPSPGRHAHWKVGHNCFGSRIPGPGSCSYAQSSCFEIITSFLRLSTSLLTPHLEQLFARCLQYYIITSYYVLAIVLGTRALKLWAIWGLQQILYFPGCLFIHCGNIKKGYTILDFHHCLYYIMCSYFRDFGPS